MRLPVQLLPTLLFVHSRLLPCAFATEDCILTIEKNGETDFVLQKELPSKCDNSLTITVNLPDGNKEFQRIMSEGPSSEAIAYWSGQDFDDGSEFDFIRGNNGNMYGSIINLGTDTVVEIAHDAEGGAFVTIKSTSDFPEEEHDEGTDEDIDEDFRNRHLEESGKLRGSRGSKVQVQPAENENKLAPTIIDNIDEHLLPKTLEFGDQNHRHLLDDTGGNLDVMIVWTRAAECEEAGLRAGCTVSSRTHENMKQMTRLAINAANTAFQSSGVQTSLHIAHSYRHPTYVEASSANTNLDLLRGTRDGHMDDVHAKRSQHGADIVALIVKKYDSCGLAPIGPSKARMFSITSVQCMLSNLSLAHEIAHNLGCKYTHQIHQIVRIFC